MIRYFLEKLKFLNHHKQFFDKMLRKFLALSSHHTEENKNSDECETCFLKVPYIGPASKQFTKSLSELVYREFGLKLMVVYDIFKINRYFQLKTESLHALYSNVVYQFRRSCDTNLAYVGKTTRHLAARACENLVSAAPHKSAIRDHIRACATCRKEKYTVNSFQSLKSCRAEYETKIQEALLIKKLNPKLNKQLYAEIASFLLSIF